MLANLCLNGEIINLHLVHQGKRVNYKAKVLLYFLGFAYCRANPYIVASFVFRLHMHLIFYSKSERKHTCEYHIGH
jgi:hypothetical protein